MRLNELDPASFTPMAMTGEPRLFVIVDTEEEFDWSAPFSRDNVGVTAIAEIGRLQDVLEPYGIVPTYVIDYPVATTETAIKQLGELAAKGECHIGAHLHPWVNPPFVEQVSGHSSFACNLGADLEREKIADLKDAILSNFGIRARVYKAGRYGFGSSSAASIEALRFDVDASVNPHMSYEAEGGPSFDRFSPFPSLFGVNRTLLELPCTTAFVGTARRIGPSLHRLASAPYLEPVRAVGVLARTGTLNKVMLSPEHSTFDEMRALTETLYRDGLRTFALTLHSPTLKPGCTEYVRTVEDRQAFLTTIRRYCAYFINELGGMATTPAELHDHFVAGKMGRSEEEIVTAAGAAISERFS